MAFASSGSSDNAVDSTFLTTFKDDNDEGPFLNGLKAEEGLRDDDDGDGEDSLMASVAWMQGSQGDFDFSGSYEICQPNITPIVTASSLLPPPIISSNKLPNKSYNRVFDPFDVDTSEDDSIVDDDGEEDISISQPIDSRVDNQKILHPSRSERLNHGVLLPALQQQLTKNTMEKDGKHKRNKQKNSKQSATPRGDTNRSPPRSKRRSRSKEKRRSQGRNSENTIRRSKSRGRKAKKSNSQQFQNKKGREKETGTTPNNDDIKIPSRSRSKSKSQRKKSSRSASRRSSQHARGERKDSSIRNRAASQPRKSPGTSSRQQSRRLFRKGDFHQIDSNSFLSPSASRSSRLCRRSLPNSPQNVSPATSKDGSPLVSGGGRRLSTRRSSNLEELRRWRQERSERSSRQSLGKESIFLSPRGLGRKSISERLPQKSPSTPASYRKHAINSNNLRSPTAGVAGPAVVGSDPFTLSHGANSSVINMRAPRQSHSDSATMRKRDLNNGLHKNLGA